MSEQESIQSIDLNELEDQINSGRNSLDKTDLLPSQPSELNLEETPSPLSPAEKDEDILLKKSKIILENQELSLI